MAQKGVDCHMNPRAPTPVSLDTFMLLGSFPVAFIYLKRKMKTGIPLRQVYAPRSLPGTPGKQSWQTRLLAQTFESFKDSRPTRCRPTT